MTTPVEATARPNPRPARQKTWKWWHPVVGLLALGAVAVAVEYRPRGGHGASIEAGETQASHGNDNAGSTPAATSVDVVVPKVGGIERKTSQPGSVHSFESVELQAMVSGYLKTQDVDIGSHVKKGQVLAEIDVPRERHAVQEAAALLEQAKVRARQAEARVKTVEADRETASATAAQVEADIARLVANRKLAEAQYLRVNSLYEHRAVDKKLVDEQLRDFEAARAAEATANLAAKTARTQLSSAAMKVEEAKVDVEEARSAVDVAESRLEKARVDVAYAKIVAPFDGVVTHRFFHPGSFIRSASDGGQSPLLTVARTDLMRVVVRVPDRDVVLASAGDPAVLTIDGLEGQVFKAPIARIAESEDPVTRTMRVEIDVPNPDGRLREGMYGRATIALEPASKSLTLPVACVLERSEKRQGVVQVVRGGKVERVKVELGTDNGSLIEVDSGLKPDDEVVLRSSVPLEAGMPVVAQSRS